MARPSSETLTPRETQVMDVLWAQGSATADEVREALRDDLHDSTVRTLLRVLEMKGYVKHDLSGKAFIYRPAVARAKVEKKALTSILKRFFGGSAQALVLRLIEDERLTPEELDEIKKRPAKGSKNPRKGRLS